MVQKEQCPFTALLLVSPEQRHHALPAPSAFSRPGQCLTQSRKAAFKKNSFDLKLKCNIKDLGPFIGSPVRTHDVSGGVTSPLGSYHMFLSKPHGSQQCRAMLTTTEFHKCSGWFRETSVVPVPCVNSSDLEVPPELGFCLAIYDMS